jgi:hypothetical protein
MLQLRLIAAAGAALALFLPAIPADAQVKAKAKAPSTAFWDGHRRDHPLCTDIIDRHYAKTKEIEAEAESLRFKTGDARNPDKLNELSQERSQIMAELQDCIMQKYSGRSFKLDAVDNDVGLPAMHGETTLEGLPLRIDLAPGHLMGDQVKGEITDHPLYDYVWGRIDRNNENLLHVDRVRPRGSTRSIPKKFDVPISAY